jgi:hypothetical protein
MGWSLSGLARKHLHHGSLSLILTLLLQLFLNPITQGDDAMEGLGYISDLLIRCKVIEGTHLQSHTLTSTNSDQGYLSHFLVISASCWKGGPAIARFR